jgi:CheY-like chemotaxis protein
MPSDQQILVVEDDAATRSAMQMVLNGFGYRVAAASNGQEALDHLRSGNGLPALILLDLMMPVMDGWRFRDEQNKDPALSSIPVVVISADGHVDQKASALGAAACLRKPIEVEELLAAVRQHC